MARWPLTLRKKLLLRKVKKFEYDDSVAPSDCAFRAFGDDLCEVFRQAALAVTTCMVKTDTVARKRTCAIELSAASEEELLYDWLSEIIFLKDSERLFLVDYEIRIETGENIVLKAQAAGDTIDYKTQNIAVDVKAVTMYKFSLRKNDSGWEAFVVIDL